MGRFVGAAHSPATLGVAICRAAQSPATPINKPRIKTCSPFFLLGSLTPTHEKKVGRPWAPPKTCSTKGEGFGLKSFGGEVVEGKKMLFHTFLSLNGWLVSN